MASKMTVLSRLQWLHDGLSGKSVTASLRLYVAGLAALAPIPIAIAFTAGTRAAFQATPFLVAALVGAEYGLAWMVESRARELPWAVRLVLMKGEEDLRQGRVVRFDIGTEVRQAVEALLQT